MIHVQGGGPTSGVYRSYLVRFWQSNEQGSWRASAQCVQTGNTVLFGSVERLLSFLQSEIGAKLATEGVPQYDGQPDALALSDNDDQSFFHAKGGKIGLWTVAVPNAFVDDFGSGALTSVTAATLDATVPDDATDDGVEITIAVDFSTDDTAVAPDDATNPDAGSLVNRAFPPLVTR